MYKCINDKLNENNIEYLLDNLKYNIIHERATGLKKVAFKPNDNVTIRFEIDPSLSDKKTAETNIKIAKRILEMLAFPIINLNFAWVDEKYNGIPNIRIIYSENTTLKIAGGTSGGGTDKVIIYLFGFSQGALLHELGHALGRLHEHINPDKSNPIKWIKEKVYEYYKKFGWSEADIDRNILAKGNSDELTVLPFDSESIMMYDIKPELNEGGIAYFRGNTYSDGDKEWFELQYGKKTKNENKKSITNMR
jgi:hypothetical protein